MKQNYNILLLTINIILYLVIIALWLSIPDSLALDISVTAFNLFLTMLLLYLNHERFKAFYQSSQFKQLSETLVFLLLVFSLLGIVNYWAFKHPLVKDFSAFKMNELTDQSKSLLKKTKGKMSMKIFARKQEAMLWIPILEMYREAKSDIEIDKIDIDVRPDLVQEYRITNEATLVIEYNDRRQYVTERDELNITNGIIKITRDSDPVVYFLTGHNEANFTDGGNEGLKFIFEATRASAIDARQINLTTTQEIPFDAKTVVLWGPHHNLMASEINALKKFLDRGGNLLIALDPDLNELNNKELRDLLLNYHINLRNDVIIDRKSFVNGSNGSIPLVESFNPDHAITKRFKGQAFFPLVASVEESEPKNKKPDEKISFLTASNNYPESWGETSIKEIAANSPSYTPGKDIAGPLNIGAVYESSKNKIVVFGNSTFVLNAYMKFGNNYALFLNSLSWLVDEDRLISFNLPIIQSEKVFISGPQLGIVFYFSVIFSPLILIGFAFYMYRRKRVK